MQKIVLAYSGGLDTSVILHWLRERHGGEIVAYTADVGQGEEVEEARVKALRTGATEAIAEDLRAPFVRDFVFPALRAAAVYEGFYLLGTALARPAITEGLIRAAVRTGAAAIAHGATGKGNDQVRFELSAYALKPDIRVIAPWREWDFKGRADLVEYAERHGIPVPVTPARPYSMDANLLHISYEGGVLEDPWTAPPAGMFRRTKDPEAAEDRPELVTIGFEGGTPVSVGGERLAPVPLLERLNEIGGRSGVGRVDMVENRFVGLKSRGVYETPGGTLLHLAHRAVESLTLDREVLHMRDGLVPRYAEMVYNGFWHSPERRALQVLMDEIARPVTGEARLKLYKGCATVEGRRAGRESLYDLRAVSFEAGGEAAYRQADATGFLRTLGHRLRTIARARGEGGA